MTAATAVIASALVTLPPLLAPVLVVDSTDVVTRPDAVSAGIAARALGYPVEVTGAATETLRQWVNPDGTMTDELAVAPVRTRRDGRWVDIDTRLAVRDGAVRPAATLGDVSFSAGGGGDMATVSYEGRSVSLGWDGRLPEPTVEGSSARYADVLPGVDLELKALRSGFEQSFVLKSRSAAAASSQLRLPLSAPGLSPVVRDGEIALTDGAGVDRAWIGSAVMWDATGRTAPVDVAVTRRSSHGTVLEMTPSAAFLNDATTIFPVTVDPAVIVYKWRDAYISSSATTTNYGSNAYLKAGIRGSTTYVSYLEYPLAAYQGKDITNVTQYLGTVDSETCSARTTSLYTVTTEWYESTVTWATRPTTDLTSSGLLAQATSAGGGPTGSSCEANAWMSFNDARLTAKFKYWADNDASNFGLSIRASTTDALAAKDFASGENSSWTPRAHITYNNPPSTAQWQSPSSTSATSPTMVATTRPTLSAVVSDSDGGTVSGRFFVYRNDTGALVINSAAGATVASGSRSAYTVGAGAALLDGVTYKLRSKAYDGRLLSTDYSAYTYFKVDVTPPAAPTVSSTAFPAGAWSGAPGATGSFTITAPVGGDIAGYRYGLDQDPPTTYTTSTSLSIPAMSEGAHTLYVRAVDGAGNLSAVTSYSFRVGKVAVTGPAAGTTTDNRVTLTAVADPAFGSLTWKWRRGQADAWQVMTGLTSTTGDARTNPISRVNGVFEPVSWAATSVGIDGPFEVMAEISGTSGPVESQPRQLLLDRAEFGGRTKTVQVGPASVDLLTGNAMLSESDVNVAAYDSDLALSRTYNSRDPQAGADGMFGPGWTASQVVESDGDYVGLTATGSLVTIGLGDGDTLQFTANADGSYTPEFGATGLGLQHLASPDRYELAETDGTTTTFTVPAGGGAGEFRPTSIKEPANASATKVDYETASGGMRIKWMLAPQPPDVTCTLTAYNVRGCRSLGFEYATSTGSAPGDYAGRLRRVSLTAWNPDAGSMTTVDVAAYEYNADGRLHAAWDPRVTPALKTTYGYDTGGHVTTITPPGLEAWTLGYSAATGETGRLLTVSRPTLTTPSTAVTTVVYGVPVSGTGAPYDLSGAQLDRIGQVDRPVDATAIFPATRVPSNPPTATDYEHATIHYLDTDGREVSTASPGGGIASTDYDPYGNVVRTLTAGNRARALDASPTDTAADEATLAETLSTRNVYSVDGQNLVETFGPEHEVYVHALGAPARGRAHTVNVYDEGALPTGARYGLVTSVTKSVWVTADSTDRDAIVSTTGYATQTDWEHRTPTSTVQDAGAGKLNLTSYTAYSADGLMTSKTLRGGTSAQNDAHTTLTVYYTFGANTVDSECGNRPEWVNLVCSTRPAAQPTVTADRPKIPTVYVTYSMYNEVRVRTEVVDGMVHRTSTTTFDPSGRESTKSLTASAGEPVSTVESRYDSSSGLLAETRTVDANGAEIDDIVRTYDTLGRVTSYADADGVTSTVTYDAFSRPTGTNDAKGSQTLTYDSTRGLLVQLADSHAGTFTATYDVDGATTTIGYPNSVDARTTYDEAGAATALDYVNTSGCSGAECMWFSENVSADIYGRWIDHSSTLSSQTYSYDNAGRLTSVEDIVAGQCTTRVYTLDEDSNRTSLVTYEPAVGGACQVTTLGSTGSRTHDASDRISTTGYVYDILGRITSTPAEDAGGAVLTAGYHANDVVRTLTQSGVTKTWTLDVAQDRIRSWTDGSTTRTNHYSGEGDSPAWTQEGAAAWTRNVSGITGGLVAVHDSGTGATELQLTNLHGDIVATASASAAAAPTTMTEATEFGIPRGTPGRRYDWLGSKSRSADALAGVVLMGVRLYNPATGRFLQRDPVDGGSDNAYEYARQNPITVFDLDGRTASCLAIPRDNIHSGGQVTNSSFWIGQREGTRQLHWNWNMGGWHTKVFMKNGVKISRVRDWRRDSVAFRNSNIGPKGGHNHGSMTMKQGSRYKFELGWVGTDDFRHFYLGQIYVEPCRCQ